MNELQLKSLETNLKEFLKSLSLEEYIKLTNWICYGITDTPFKKPDAISEKFIEEFLGKDTFAKIVYDLRKNPSFLNAKLSEHDLFETLRSGLVQHGFFKLRELVELKPLVLTKNDKENLNEILNEHKAMLNYQLQDEDFIRSCDEDGDKLIAEKKRHLKFIKKIIA